MRNAHAYKVIPNLPPKLRMLKDLAYNVYWSWDDDVLFLFRRMDPELWESTHHNPVLMLGTIAQEKLEALAQEDAFLANMERAWRKFDHYMKMSTWYDKVKKKAPEELTVAYFSAEFGITEAMPIYSGGLGVLAGDHMKSASELGLPLYGVGLLYQTGYFQQSLSTDGWQQEKYPQNDFYNLPVQPILGKDGLPLKVHLEWPGRTLTVKVWQMLVGRVTLVLLDTNIPENTPEDRKITGALYGGDKEMRIQQEIVLGIGGLRALRAMELHPNVCHMNEGHAAFSALERIRMRLKTSKSMGFAEARESTACGNVFTTHTPVPAGFDVFSQELMKKYFGEFYKELGGIAWEDFMALGRLQGDATDGFNMAYLALHMADYVNGVSKLHGKVTRSMWKNHYPEIPHHEIPITSVTNGIHTRSWVSKEMGELLERYLGDKWIEEPGDQTIWGRVETIPDSELWRTHERRRERLVAFARRSLKKQFEKRGAMRQTVESAEEVLNPRALTIGFARRFATYKRATLLLSNPGRLKKILNNPERPVQFIFAGKAHPKDEKGKEFIKKIVHFARQEDVRHNIVFVENYDMNVARYMVQGVDVWLNNPLRPLEASGTSGMKVLPNGGLNCSILDGWWDEGYAPEYGWAIGHGEEDYPDQDVQDKVEADILYNILEDDLVPLFYERGRDGLPRGWIKKMKASMTNLCPVFNTNRMVEEYVERFYFGAGKQRQHLKPNDWKRARDLAGWKEKVQANWNGVSIAHVESEQVGNDVLVGNNVKVSSWVKLGKLTPKDVIVQAYYGKLDEERKIREGNAVTLKWVEESGGSHKYAGEIPCETSGQHGFEVRVMPDHEDLIDRFRLALIRWEA